MYKHCWKMILCTLLIVILAESAEAEIISRKHLDNQASNYLELLDQNQYEDAWLAMSDFFQALHNQNHWQSRQQAMRAAYGSLVSREFFRITDRRSYSHSPDGRYVTVQYESIFQNKANTYETVVLDCGNSSSCSVRDYVLR